MPDHECESYYLEKPLLTSFLLQEKAELADNMSLIDWGHDDIKAGRVRDARNGVRTIAVKHGISLTR